MLISPFFEDESLLQLPHCLLWSVSLQVTAHWAKRKHTEEPIARKSATKENILQAPVIVIKWRKLGTQA